MKGKAREIPTVAGQVSSSHPRRSPRLDRTSASSSSSSLNTEKKLEEFRRILQRHPDAWLSWEENGEVKTFGAREEFAAQWVHLPLHLTGNRDAVMKPKLLEIATLLSTSTSPFSSSSL